MKCLPSNKLHLAKGNALHDWHAEVLALRALNRFLLDECLLLLNPPYTPSAIIRRSLPEEITPLHPYPFTIREDVDLHMYCSEAPCGDASMELTMSLQEDATPWTSPLPTVSSATPPSSDSQDQDQEPPTSALRGRSHFSHLGAVRCKPSRPDAPPTFSKSCSDKLALTQATSVLSSLTSTLISPRNAYLRSLTMPASQHVPLACERAFSRSGRMSGITDEMLSKWQGGYVWRAFEVQSTQREFEWCRRAVCEDMKPAPSNLSAVWMPASQETLIGGVLQGRKQFDARGASALCRRSIWKLAMQVVSIIGTPALAGALAKGTYAEVKASEILRDRRKVKDDVRRTGLKGWVKNSGDESFSLEV